MNGARLESILRKDPKCASMFVGVFACDRLPTRLDSMPAILICNTDPHNKPGTHWITIYIENSSYGEFFDSYGLPPQAPFRSFLQKHSTNWIYNRRHLQSSISRFCGHYCIFYCTQRARNKNVNAIANLLTRDTALNDFIVHTFVCKMIA